MSSDILPVKQPPGTKGLITCQGCIFKVYRLKTLIDVEETLEHRHLHQLVCLISELGPRVVGRMRRRHLWVLSECL